jgi:hypothetical protein
LTVTTSPEDLDGVVVRLLQTQELPLGTVLRELIAHGASRATADTTVASLVNRGRVIRTNSWRLVLASAADNESDD